MIRRGSTTEAAAGALVLPPPPDYVEPLQAWRLWAVENVAGSPRLRSLYRSCVWPVGVPLAARCHSRRFRLWRRTPHEAPVAKCTCGIYAVPPGFVSKLSRDGALTPGRTLVLGTVSLWGEVVECERGWRAASAYPSRLYVPSVCPHAERTAVGLEDYGVPVDVLEVRNMKAALEAATELSLAGGG